MAFNCFGLIERPLIAGFSLLQDTLILEKQSFVLRAATLVANQRPNGGKDCRHQSDLLRET